MQCVAISLSRHCGSSQSESLKSQSVGVPFSQIQTKLIIAHGNFNFKQGYIGETYMFPPKKKIIVMESSNQSPAKMKGFHITGIPGPPNTFVKIWA